MKRKTTYILGSAVALIVITYYGYKYQKEEKASSCRFGAIVTVNELVKNGVYLEKKVDRKKIADTINDMCDYRSEKW